MDKNLLLRWYYSSGAPYDYYSDDCAALGQLYRLKVLEKDIRKVELWAGTRLVICWVRQEGDE